MHDPVESLGVRGKEQVSLELCLEGREKRKEKADKGEKKNEAQEEQKAETENKNKNEF